MTFKRNSARETISIQIYGTITYENEPRKNGFKTQQNIYHPGVHLQA